MEALGSLVALTVGKSPMLLLLVAVVWVAFAVEAAGVGFAAAGAKKALVCQLRPACICLTAAGHFRPLCKLDF